MPDVQLSDGPGEVDILPGHPSEHDEKVCGEKNCVACIRKKHWKSWCSSAASPSPLDKNEVVVWAQQAPRRWKCKSFFLGCSPCYARMMTTAWEGSKWAKFKIDTIRDGEQIKQHNRSRQHKLSVDGHFKVHSVQVQLKLGKKGRPATLEPVRGFGQGRPALLDYARILFGNSKHQSSRHVAAQSVMDGTYGIRMDVTYTCDMRNKVRAVMHEVLKRKWRQGFWSCKDAAYQSDGKMVTG